MVAEGLLGFQGLRSMVLVKLLQLRNIPLQQHILVAIFNGKVIHGLIKCHAMKTYGEMEI
jgi:hypothetical protein